MTNRDHFTQAETLRTQADIAYAAATDALMRGDKHTYHTQNGLAHNLRNAASGEYHRAGVRQTGSGEPYKPDVSRL